MYRIVSKVAIDIKGVHRRHAALRARGSDPTLEQIRSKYLASWPDTLPASRFISDISVMCYRIRYREDIGGQVVDCG
jgi:hypothetical protein